MVPPPDGGGQQRTLVNVEDASCSLMMGIPTEEWDYLPSPGLMFYHNSSQEVLQMKLITDKVQEVLSRNKHNANIMHVGDTILADAAEAIID